MTAVRALYRLVQRLLAAVGIYFVACRISKRQQPQVVNRSIWKPFVVADEWLALYLSTQAITHGAATDNVHRQVRFYSTFQMAAYAAALPQGDVVECGCWHGHTTVAIATILQTRGFAGRFHVFDSFEGGLSDFTPNDESIFPLSDREKRGLVRQFASDYELVSSVTKRFGFVELHRGWIPQSFESFVRTPLRFVHVDVDMYEPTKAALDFFWDFVVPGGCIVIDDYNHTVFEGATRAVDEFLKGKRPSLFYAVPFGGSCYVIK
jgi:O-methyltransferase